MPERRMYLPRFVNNTKIVKDGIYFQQFFSFQQPLHKKIDSKIYVETLVYHVLHRNIFAGS